MESNSQNKLFEYDTVPYPSYTFPQTHPGRLSTIAAFHGLESARPDKCRYLELGCGDGTNILSIAYSFPHSAFFGIDLSAVHINAANDSANGLKLSNAELICDDVMNFTRDRFGEFDFIVAHGLFSWVPGVVRERLLAIYNDCLAPNGVGYISFNAYPGCHIREMAWDMMRFHASNFREPLEQVKEGKNILKAVESMTSGDDLYRMLIANEARQIEHRSPENVYHDDFSGMNQPFYFHEFAGQLAEHGLQFLSEAEPQSLSLGNFGAEAREIVESFGDDVVAREQYIDFLRCRRFRNSLVCRENIKLERHFDKNILKRFFITTDVRPATDDAAIDNEQTVTFVDSRGKTFETNHPFTKAFIETAGRHSPIGQTFDTIAAAATEMVDHDQSQEGDVNKTAEFLLQLFFAGLVRLNTFQPQIELKPGQYPKTSAFARHQVIGGSSSVTTIAGTNLELDDVFARKLLLLADGTRSRDEIASAIADDPDLDFEGELTPVIDAILEKFAAFALLIRD